MVRLSEEEIATRLAGLPGWSLTDGCIRKTYAFRSFHEAVEFTRAVAEVAEALQHQPQIDIRHTEVTVILPPRDGGGISDLEIALASHVEEAQG